MVVGTSAGKKYASSFLKFGVLWGLFCFFFSFEIRAQELNEIRREYYEAVNSGTAADDFYNKLHKLQPSKPVLFAYYGSAQALKSRYSFNPYNKIKYLNEGRKTLARAVAKSPDDLEIRFLRFSLEHYIPAFLGMSDNLDIDRKKIILLIKKKQYGAVDKSLLKNLISFLKQTKRCTPRELHILAEAGS